MVQGPSGAGKTTVCKEAIGLNESFVPSTIEKPTTAAERAETAVAWRLGMQAFPLSALEKQMGYVAQEEHFLDNLSVVRVECCADGWRRHGSRLVTLTACVLPHNLGDAAGPSTCSTTNQVVRRVCGRRTGDPQLGHYLRPARLGAQGEITSCHWLWPVCGDPLVCCRRIAA